MFFIFWLRIRVGDVTSIVFLGCWSYSFFEYRREYILGLWLSIWSKLLDLRDRITSFLIHHKPIFLMQLFLFRH